MQCKRLFARVLAWLLAASLVVLVVSACAPTQRPEDAEAQQPVAEADSQTGLGDSVSEAPASVDSEPEAAQTDTSTIDQALELEDGAVPSDAAVAADEGEATSSLSEDPAQQDPQVDPEPAALEPEPVDAAEEPAPPTDAAQGESTTRPPDEPSHEAGQAAADAAERESGPTGAIEESPPQGAVETEAPVDSTDSESADAADSPQDAHREEAAYWNPVATPGVPEPEEEVRLAVTLEELEGVYAASSCGMDLALTIYAAIDGRAPGHFTSAETGTRGCIATLENDVLVLLLIDHSVMRLEVVSSTALRNPETFTVFRKQ